MDSDTAVRPDIKTLEGQLLGKNITKARRYYSDLMVTRVLHEDIERRMPYRSTRLNVAINEKDVITEVLGWG